MKKRMGEALAVLCLMLCMIMVGGFLNQSPDIIYHEDGTITLGEGLVAYGFYTMNGLIVNDGEKLTTENGSIKGIVNIQQNLPGTVNYGLLLMQDFIQQDFYVNEEKYQIYQFSMTGIDEKNIEIELSVEENATEFEYLIVRSPDMTGFENEQGLDWEKLIDSKNAYSFFAVLDETANEMKQDAAYLYKTADEMETIQSVPGLGFELLKTQDNLSVFGEASAGDKIGLGIGSLLADAEQCYMIAFCNWKQAVIEEQAKVIIYPKMDKMLYDEIELPQVDGDAVYQVFLFELHGDLQRRVHPSFRMDLKGEKD